MCTVNSVASPFILYDVVIEAAQSSFLSSGHPTSSSMSQPFRSALITPLIQKCQQM